MKKKIIFEDNEAFQNNCDISRCSEKKVTNSFVDNGQMQSNFLEKGSILKHFVNRIITKKNAPEYEQSRSIRDFYKKNVQQLNKMHTVINNGLMGIVKKKASNKGVPRLSKQGKKKKSSYQIASVVKFCQFLFILEKKY